MYNVYDYISRVEGFVDLEKEFEQNTLNSAVFLISITMQVSNFAVNYKVLPYIEIISGDKIFCFGIFCFKKFSSFIAHAHSLSLSLHLQGHPFMMGLKENKPLLICLMMTGSVVLVLASGLFPGVCEYLEIVEFPYEVCYMIFIPISASVLFYLTLCIMYV